MAFCDTPNEPAPAWDAPRVLMRGLANAGKTSRACAHVRDLIAHGVPAGQVVVFAPTPAACRDFERALGPEAAGVRVCTAFDFELGVLASPEAQAFTRRRARVLCDFEESFLLEDLRATGIPARRLKGMLGFFRKSMTELADDDIGSLIIDAREQAVWDALHRHLQAYDAMLDCEVANLCVRYLREHPETCEGLGAAHVVVDDYQCLNRASQAMVELLGARTLWAFADETLAAQGADPFPCVEGMGRFCAEGTGTAVVELAPPAGGAARAAAQLVGGGYLDALSLGLQESRGKVAREAPYEVVPCEPGLAGVDMRTYADPDAELAGVQGYVKGLLAQGTDPAGVLVLAPNRAWAGRVAASLARAGVAVEARTECHLAGGSFRDLAKCRTGRLYTALALMADPDDSLAWRCWCGCGDYLARSNVFTGVEELARGLGVGLGEALRLLDAGQAPAVPGQEGVLVAWRQGREMVEGLAGLRGTALLEALAEGLGLDGVPDGFARLAGEGLAGPQADARALFAAAQDVSRHGEAVPGGVRVALYERACACKASHVVVCGLMNGWMPEHAYFDLAEADFDARAKLDAQARSLMYELASCATDELVLTGFASCDLEFAERMHLRGYKVAMGDDGRRTTTVRPSDLAAYALHAWGLAPLPARSLLRDFSPARVNA